LNSFSTITSKLLQDYSQRGILWTIDGMQPVEQVAKSIVSCFELAQTSYYVSTPSCFEKSSRFHGHLDACNHSKLLKLAKSIQSKVPDTQSKIYPVLHLRLGPQISNVLFTEIYNSLPNFHSINAASNEAFLTSKMGDDGFDYEHILATLQIASNNPGCGIMTELEEELFTIDFDSKGLCKSNRLDCEDEEYELDWRLLGKAWKLRRVNHIPRFELHHGFDVMKHDDHELPVDLDVLMQTTTQFGLECGGWFVFAKADRWSYRCNEFSHESNRQVVQSKLMQQVETLRKILHNWFPDTEYTSCASLERVHAIWKF
jgi:hypothetical protein